jgi:hypothetical protein
MADSRYTILDGAMKAWIAQFRKDIKLDHPTNRRPSSPVHTVDVYGLGIRPGYYSNTNAKNETLWQKAEVRKGTVVLTDMEGKKWQQGANGFTEIVPKRVLSQASKLKNRYRRGLITIPRQIAKMEAAIEEQRLEQPILTDEANRLYRQLSDSVELFEKYYGMSVKPYPYHQSIARFASKLGSEKFAIMSNDFWELRHIRVRYEDLTTRLRTIGRYIRSAEHKIEKAKERQKKLSHGQDPNKKLAWEK